MNRYTFFSNYRLADIYLGRWPSAQFSPAEVRKQMTKNLILPGLELQFLSHFDHRRHKKRANILVISTGQKRKMVEGPEDDVLNVARRT
jgi:hypothetical protein